jgi:hypothetical protein
LKRIFTDFEEVTLIKQTFVRKLNALGFYQGRVRRNCSISPEFLYFYLIHTSVMSLLLGCFAMAVTSINAEDSDFNPINPEMTIAE